MPDPDGSVPASAPGTSAPASAPDAASSTPDVASSATEWDNLGFTGDDDSVEVPVETVEEQPAAPVVEVKPDATPPVVPPPVTPPQPAPAAVTPPQEAASPAPAKVEAPADASPQGLVQQLEQHRGAVIDALAADRFKLTPEEATALDTDAIAAIPRVMARVYYEAMQSTLLNIQNHVPRMVKELLRTEKVSSDAETAFYGQFKTIDRGKHHADVVAFANGFRQMNPQISQADLFAMVGAAIMAKHGLGAAPAAPVVSNGGGQTQVPFVPAVPGATVRTTQEPVNPWEGLGKDFDDE